MNIDFTPLREYRLAREDALDLQFRGYRISEGKCGDREYEIDWTRSTHVRLYYTDTDKWVVETVKASKWQGERSRHSAKVYNSFRAVVTGVVEENGGRLGPASKQAIEAAVELLPDLEGSDVEVV